MMKEIGGIKFYDFEEILEEHYGKIGTPKRDEFEHSVDESVRAYKLGEAVKKARLAQNLTQEQLGEKVGVKKAQISRVEKGRCMSLTTISRIFRAMSIPLTIEIGNMDKLAMW